MYRISLFLTLIILLNISAFAGSQLLTNPGFESDATGWSTWQWSAGFVGTAQDPAIQLDGKYLYAGQTGPGDWDGGGGAYQMFSANEGDVFYVSGMAKAEGTSPRAT